MCKNLEFIFLISDCPSPIVLLKQCLVYKFIKPILTYLVQAVQYVHYLGIVLKSAKKVNVKQTMILELDRGQAEENLL